MRLKKIKNSVSGNPRYVIHFFDFLSFNERYDLGIVQGYDLAVKRASSIGGKRYNTKDYPYHIVFQSYNTYNTKNQIKKLVS